MLKMKLNNIAQSTVLLFILLINGITVFGVISRRTHPLLTSLFSTANRARGTRTQPLVPYRRSYSVYNATRYFNNFARRYDRGTTAGNQHGTHTIHSLARAADLRGRHRPSRCKHCQIFRRRNINPPPGLLFGSGVLPAGTKGDIGTKHQQHGVMKSHAKPVIPSEFHVHTDNSMIPPKVKNMAKAKNAVIKQTPLDGRMMPPYKAMNQIPSSTLNDLIKSPVSTLNQDYGFIYNVLDNHTPPAAVPRVTNLVPIKPLHASIPSVTSNKVGMDTGLVPEITNVPSVPFIGPSLGVNTHLFGSPRGHTGPSPVLNVDNVIHGERFHDGTIENVPSIPTTSFVSPAVGHMNNELHRPDVSIQGPILQPNHPIQGIHPATLHGNDVLQANVGALDNPIDLVNPNDNEGSLLRNPSSIPSLDVIGDILQGDIHSMNSMDMQRFLPSLVPAGQQNTNPTDFNQNIPPPVSFPQSEMPIESVQAGFVPNRIMDGTEMLPRGEILDNQAPHGFTPDSIIPPIMENGDRFRQQLPISGAIGNFERVTPVDDRSINGHASQHLDNGISDMSTHFAESNIPLNAADGFISLGPEINTIEGQQSMHMKESGVSGSDINQNVGGVSANFIPSDIPLNIPDGFISFGTGSNNIEGQQAIDTTSGVVDVPETNTVVEGVSTDFVPSDIPLNAADGFVNLSPESTLDHQHTLPVEGMSNINSFDQSISINQDATISNQHVDVLTDTNNVPNIDLTMQQLEQSIINGADPAELPLPPVEVRAPFDETAHQNVLPDNNININQIGIEPPLPEFISETVHGEPMVEIIPHGADLGINLPNDPGVIDQTPSHIVQVSLIPELMEKHGSGILQREPIGGHLENSVGGVPVNVERIGNQMVNIPGIQHTSESNIVNDVSPEFVPTDSLNAGDGFLNVLPESKSNIVNDVSPEFVPTDSLNAGDGFLNVLPGSKSNIVNDVSPEFVPTDSLNAGDGFLNVLPESKSNIVNDVSPEFVPTDSLNAGDGFLNVLPESKSNIVNDVLPEFVPTDILNAGDGFLNVLPESNSNIEQQPTVHTQDVSNINTLENSMSIDTVANIDITNQHVDVTTDVQNVDLAMQETSFNDSIVMNTTLTNIELAGHSDLNPTEPIVLMIVPEAGTPDIFKSNSQPSHITGNTASSVPSKKSLQSMKEVLEINHHSETHQTGLESSKGVTKHETVENTLDTNPTHGEAHFHAVAHAIHNKLQQPSLGQSHTHSPTSPLHDGTTDHITSTDANWHIGHSSQLEVGVNSINDGQTLLKFEDLTSGGTGDLVSGGMGDLVSGGIGDLAISNEHPQSTVNFPANELTLDLTVETKPLVLSEPKTHQHTLHDELMHANGQVGHDAPITVDAALNVPPKVSKPVVEINHHSETPHTIGVTKHDLPSANTLSTKPNHGEAPSRVLAHDIHNELQQPSPTSQLHDSTTNHMNTPNAQGHIDHSSQTLLKFEDSIGDAGINTEHPQSTVSFPGETSVEHTVATKPMSLPESKLVNQASNKITNTRGHDVHGDVHIASIHDQINQVPQEMGTHSHSADGINITKHQTSQIMNLLSGGISTQPAEHPKNVHITADEVWSLSFDTPIPSMVGELETSHQSHTRGPEASVPATNHMQSSTNTHSSNPNHSEILPHTKAHDIHNTVHQPGMDHGMQSAVEGIDPTSDLLHNTARRPANEVAVNHIAGETVIAPHESVNTQNTNTVITNEENVHGSGSEFGFHDIAHAVKPDIFTQHSLQVNPSLNSILSPLSGPNGNQMVSTDLLQMLVNAELSPSDGSVQTKHAPII